MLKLSISCTRFESNYSSRTCSSSEKIYVAAVQALNKKETQDQTQLTTKIGGKTSLGPSNYLL